MLALFTSPSFRADRSQELPASAGATGRHRRGALLLAVAACVWLAVAAITGVGWALIAAILFACAAAPLAATWD